MMNPIDLLNNVKSLILDFDGTIADTSKFHELAFRQAFEPYKISFDYKKIAGKRTSEAVFHCGYTVTLQMEIDINNCRRQNLRNNF